MISLERLSSLNVSSSPRSIRSISPRQNLDPQKCVNFDKHPNADTDEMLEAKKQWSEEDHLRKIQLVRARSLERRIGSRPQTAPSVRRMSSTGFKFNDLQTRNAECEIIINQKKKLKLEEQEMRMKRVAQQRAGIAKSVPKMNFIRSRKEYFRTRNAESEIIRQRKIDHIKKQEKKKMKRIAKHKAWKRGIAKSPIAQRKNLSIMKDPNIDFRTANADSEKHLEMKIKLQEEEAKELMRKVAERRKEAIERRNRIKLFLNDKTMAAGENKKQFVSTMKNRKEAWQAVNAETPEMIEKKKKLNEKKEQLRRKRVAALKANRERNALARSMNCVPMFKPKIFRTHSDPQASLRSANAETPQVYSMKMKAVKKENQLQEARVQARRRKKMEMKNERLRALTKTLESKNMSSKMKKIFTRCLSPKSPRYAQSVSLAKTSPRKSPRSLTTTPRSKISKSTIYNRIRPQSARVTSEFKRSICPPPCERNSNELVPHPMTSRDLSEIERMQEKFETWLDRYQQ